MRRHNCVATIASPQLRRHNCVATIASPQLRRHDPFPPVHLPPPSPDPSPFAPCSFQHLASLVSSPQVCEELKLQAITSGLAVTYFDRYASRSPHAMSREHVEVTALICIHIATKFVETKVLHLEELGNVSAQGHAKGKLKLAELRVLQCIDWQLQLATPHPFLEQLVRLVGLDSGRVGGGRARGGVGGLGERVGVGGRSAGGRSAASSPYPPAESGADAAAAVEADGASTGSTTATEDLAKLSRAPSRVGSCSDMCAADDETATRANARESSHPAADVCDLSIVPAPVPTPAASAQYIYKRAELLIDLSYHNFELLPCSPLVIAAGALLCGWQQLQDVEAEARHGPWLAVVCGVQRAELFRCKHILHEHFKTISTSPAARMAPSKQTASAQTHATDLANV